MNTFESKYNRMLKGKRESGYQCSEDFDDCRGHQRSNFKK